MENQNKKGKSSFGHNSLANIYILSNIKEPKVKKNWFIKKFDGYISTIDNDFDKISKEESERLKKKNNLNSTPLYQVQHSKTIYPEIKSCNHTLEKSKRIIFNLKKSKQNKNLLNIFNKNNDISKNNSSIHLDSQNEPKNKTINTISSKNINLNRNFLKNNKINNISKISKLDFSTIPNIPHKEINKIYITNYINNIYNKIDLLDKKLLKKEKLKAIGFKSKYNRLFNDYKKIKIDINQYVKPKKDKRYIFNLNKINDRDNNEMSNLRTVMKQISNKVRNRNKNKPPLKDIINEIENFKFKEKILREKIQKNHEKFDYLIQDSNIIQKRIDLKCRKK